MKVHLLNSVKLFGLNYSPEPSGNAPYTAGLAEGLVKRGRSVQVFTGVPHYPEWKRREGYLAWRGVETINGVPIVRLNHYIPRKARSSERLWMELSFGLRLIGSNWGTSGVLVLVSPALFSTGLALLRARATRQRASVIVWVQDLYSLGMRETGTSGSVGTQVMSWLEGKILRSADGVVVIHDRFRSYVIESLGVDPAKVQVIRNWTHLKPFVLADRAATRASFGWAPDDIVVLHAGNMGLKQGLENVVEAAHLAESRASKVRFILLGSGNQRSRLEQLSKGIHHIEFVDPLPGTRFQEALAAADVLLVNELPGVKEMSVPSKLTSYFSSRVPVLAATDEGSVTAEEIATAQAGLRVNAGSPEELVHGAEALVADEDQARRFAENGLRFMETTLSEKRAIAQYDQYLKKFAAGSQSVSRH